MAACEPANSADLPEGRAGLLLHGLYVDPRSQGQGVGQQLFRAVEEKLRQEGYDGLLVKAQPDATGFFQAMGMQGLESRVPARDYPYRYWKPTKTPA